uniref:peptidyl-prolyl cis-trans isomerase A-like n=1 Tax=Halichoerus grypus TaxID=9711 RepID=UPI00165A0C09|nr:peptidyl-prolyl cis-trans isomerase A-like [Halichoerus grypus]
MMDGEPLSRISFKLFADKVPKAAENVCALHTGEKRLFIKFPAFTGLFRDLCARVVTSQAIMALAASSSMGRNLMMRISSQSIWVLASCPWQVLDPTQTIPFFVCTAKTEWLDGKHVVFGKVKEGMNFVEAWKALGPRMARPARRSQLLTVDKSNKSDLCFI